MRWSFNETQDKQCNRIGFVPAGDEHISEEDFPGRSGRDSDQKNPIVSAGNWTATFHYTDGRNAVLCPQRLKKKNFRSGMVIDIIEFRKFFFRTSAHGN